MKPRPGRPLTSINHGRPVHYRILRDTAGIIRAHRKAHNITQSELAEKAGVAKGTLQSLERGTALVNLPNILAVLNAVGHDLAVTPLKKED